MSSAIRKIKSKRGLAEVFGEVHAHALSVGMIARPLFRKIKI